jgi:hypothetical protein
VSTYTAGTVPIHRFMDQERSVEEGRKRHEQEL